VTGDGADDAAVVAEMAGALSNWGRWGPDDERGTLNLITPEKRAAAATLVRRGEVFALDIPLDAHGPQGGPRNPRSNPIHVVTRTGQDPPEVNGIGGTTQYTDDLAVLYLQAGTQWDSLAHVYYDDQLYNGHPASTVTARGAEKNGVDKYHDRFVSRGVLLDIARLHGLERLDDGHDITSEELDAASDAASLEVEPGDIVLVRTGLMSTWRETRRWDAFRGRNPGVHYTTARWFAAHGVAALACDNVGVERPGGLPTLAVPFHMLALRDMGMPLGEYWYLEDLADDCAGDGRYEFLLVAPALKVTGAVGSPVTPLAIK